MTKRPTQFRNQQLFQAINEYLQNAGLMQRSFAPIKTPQVRKLELVVRSLNLQRLP